MATKLYFHDAAFTGWPGTFPSGEQSAVTPTSTATGATVLRKMDTTIGTGQVSVATPTLAVTTIQNQLIRMFVSPVIAIGDTISLMNFWCATLETNLNVNLSLSFNIYTWNPTTGTRSAGYDGVNAGRLIATEQTAAGTEQVYGANTSVNAFIASAGDVLVLEVWTRFAQAMGTAYSTSFFYDGTTESTTLNATVSNIASYVEFPDITLTFSSIELLDADLTALASQAGNLSQTSFSAQTVGASTGVTRAVLPSYQTGDLILGMAYRDGSTTAPTVPSGWTTQSTATNTTSSAVLVSKVAASSVVLNPFGTVTESTLPASFPWSYVAYGAGRFIGMCNSNSVVVSSTDGVTWTQGTNLTGASAWSGVTYGAGLFVVITGGSAVSNTSPDGLAWTQRTLPFAFTYLGYGNGMFVALAGGSSSASAATSPDGIAWTSQTLPLSASWRAIAYGNGTFVIVAQGPSTVAATSPDGVTWTRRTLPASANWGSVAFGNGTFVAIVSNSTVIATSPDGVIWTQRAVSTGSWSSVCFGNGQFVILSSFGSTVLTSPDGITWTSKSWNTSGTWATLAFNNEIAVSVAKDSTLAARITATTDSDVFTNATSVAFNVYRGVDGTTPIGNVTSATGTGTTATVPALTLAAPAQNPFEVAFVASRSTDVLFPSSFGSTQQVLPASRTWYSVAYGNNVYAAVAYGASSSASSADGKTWTSRTIAFGNWTSVTFGNGKFVAITASSTVAATSTDAITWTPQTLPSASPWRSVAYGNSVFVAVSYNSTSAATSPDGVTWTARTMPSAASWNIITFGNGKFVAVAQNGSVATSTDGITWTPQTLPTASTWYSVAYGNGTFVAVGYGTSATSTDGATWVQHAMPVSAAWTTIAFGNGVFMAVTIGIDAATSTDGVTWTQRSMPVSATWQAIIYGSGEFAAIATSSALAASIDDWVGALRLRDYEIDAVDAIAAYDSGGAAPQTTV